MLRWPKGLGDCSWVDIPPHWDHGDETAYKQNGPSREAVDKHSPRAYLQCRCSTGCTSISPIVQRARRCPLAPFSSLAMLRWVGGEVADRAQRGRFSHRWAVSHCWTLAMCSVIADRVWGGMGKDAVRTETLDAASGDCAWASETKCGRQRGAWAHLGIWCILSRP
jgi:hypothetical protein